MMTLPGELSAGVRDIGASLSDVCGAVHKRSSPSVVSGFKKVEDENH